jgi:2-polyprenyl-6-methoxyphenol hydroxylase-like FAD-dependent oxidoreductase
MTEQRERAIVIGASMGGLLAARVLADHYGQVTLVERDAIPPVGEHRRGVPQGRHAHGLLARGREVLEQLLPGLTADLVAQGAALGDLQDTVRWYSDGHRMCRARSGLDGLLVSRPLLEGYVRERVRSLPNVSIIDQCSVQRLETTADRRRVTGIELVDRHSAPITLDADLVVDTTGRGSRSPAWLESLGYDAPVEESIHVAIGYATRHYRRRPTHLDGDMAVVISAVVPQGRSGVVLALEGDRWVVSLGGHADDIPPTDPDEWVAFANTLPVNDIAELIRDAEPLDDPARFRYPASIRRRYERLRRFPDDYLVFGDALCSFNPIYGQGMTVAALEALALDECLSRSPSALARDFFHRAARLIDVPWQIAVGADLRFDHVTGKRTAKVRFVNRYLSRLHVAAERDPVLGTAFLRVVNLVDRPESLLAPRIAWRVLRGNLRSKPASAPTATSPALAAQSGSSSSA